MTEILSIFIQFLIFLTIFSFPFTPKFLANSLVTKNDSIGFIDSQSLNIIFFCYIALVFSFLNLDLEILFKFYFLFSLIFLIFNLKKFYSFKKNDYYLFFIFILIVFSIFFSIAQNLKLEWDGQHWLEKALVFINGQNIENLKNVSRHPEYPHLSSYVWAFFWKNSLLEIEYFGRYFHVYFYVISIFLILKRLNNNKKIFQVSIILFFILITYEPYLFAGYQEYLIFSSLIVAARFISLIDFKKINNLKLIYLSILILYINCWFKDEGLVYFVIFSSLLILSLNIPSYYRFTFCLIIIGLVIIQFLLQKYLIGIYDFPQKTSFSNIFSDLSNVKILITKFSKIIFHCLISFIKYPLWLIILISVFFQFYLIKKFNPYAKYLLTCLIFNFIFILSIFFTFNNFDFMLRVSLDRLLFQTSGFYIPFFIITINNLRLFKK